MVTHNKKLTAASVKITAFSDVVPCSLVEVYRRFRGACCLLASIAVIEAARDSETSVYFRVTTRACHLQEVSQFVFFIRHQDGAVSNLATYFVGRTGETDRPRGRLRRVVHKGNQLHEIGLIKLEITV
jgi:hypothetical protein